MFLKNPGRLSQCFVVSSISNSACVQNWLWHSGYMVPVSFGMMLGWASSAYPVMLQWDTSPIPIDLDQTALIAGFLMEGNSVGVLFSTWKHLGSKPSVFLCCCFQFFGWAVMLGAKDVLGVFISRFSIGFGNGWGTGQLKRYIKETCEPELAEKLCHHIPVGVSVGIIIIFIVGSCVSFRVMSIFGMVVPLIGAITFGLIPKKIYNAKRIDAAKNVLDKTVNLDLGKIQKVFNDLKADECVEKQANVLECLMNKRCRNGLMLIFLIVLIQQYICAPSNIIYGQIIFTATENPYPVINSIIYTIFFLFSTIISLKYTKNFPRKANLLITTGLSTLSTSLVALYFLWKQDLLKTSEYFSWAPLLILLFFNFNHTFGMSTIPSYILAEKIPKRCRNVIGKFLVIHFSMSSVFSNKIFQVMFGNYDMFTAYAFCAVVGVCGFFLMLIFMEEYDVEVEKGKLAEKMDQKVETIDIVTRL